MPPEPAAPIPRCTITTPHSHSSFDDPIICPLRGDEEETGASMSESGDTSAHGQITTDGRESVTEQRDLSAYDGLSREQLVERLSAAEDVCLMFGWCPSRSDGMDREKAAYMLWCRWYDLVGGEKFGRPKNHPHLSDERITALAEERDQRRLGTLAAINKMVVTE